MQKLIRSPWLTIWINPRETIRQVIRSRHSYLMLAIVATASFNATLNRFRLSEGAHADTWSVLASNLLIGVPFAMLVFFIEAAFLKITGSWLNGKASHEDIQAAVAWSRVPIVWGLLVWILRIAVFEERAFPYSSAPKASLFSDTIVLFNPFSGVQGAFLFAILNVLSAAVSIWAFIILLNCLAEVQGYSIRNALLNVVLGFALPLVPFLLLLMPFLMVRA